jgi:pimeloyl-ACP methyl ester carboxylesterase
MGSALIAVAVLVAIAALLLRFAFPKQLVRLLRGLLRRYARMRERSVQVNGVTWPYLEGGPASADVIVLVHGFGADKDNWPMYARSLTGQYRVLAPDLVGFGDNVLDANADYRVPAQAERLMQFIDTLGIERFHIGGNSMGGAIALRCGIDYPARIRTIALIDNAGVASINKSQLEVAAARGENPLVISSLDQLDEFLAFVTEKLPPFPELIKRDIGERIIERREFLEKTFWSLYEDIDTRPMDDRLHEVAAPTLIIWGRQDRVLDVSCTETMTARIPENTCVVFEGIGHVPMLECAADAASAHLEHLRRYHAA